MSAALKSYLNEYRLHNTNVYAIPGEIFKTIEIKPWKYNRPADMSRVPEIHNWMNTSKRMDGILNLAYIQRDGLVCFEGNHRRMALDGIDSILVIAEILWDTSDEIIRSEFQRINKSISVPDLYVAETDADVKVEIENAVAAFRKKYPSHETHSGRPNRPNFNRDKLTDDLLRLHKELVLPINVIIDRLHMLNELYEMKDRTSLNAKIVEKCSKSGLWLFAWSTTISANEL
jgi:hypothetical protein